jgi:uncharacterized membrane protein
MNVREGRRDLLVACVAAAAAAAVAALGDGSFLRAVLGVPAVLLLPGHALLRASGVRTATWTEHVVYAIGASLAATVAGGFVLNALGRLSPTGWSAWFLVVVLAAAAFAARRRDLPDLPAWTRPRGILFRHFAAAGIASSLATAAYALAVRDEAYQQQFKYTEFWMLPSAAGGTLSVGVRSGETRTLQYDLEVALDGQPFVIFRSLSIAPGEVWTREIPVNLLAAPQNAEARLYRLEDERIYRRVSARVPRSLNATE